VAQTTARTDAHTQTQNTAKKHKQIMSINSLTELSKINRIK